jgi:hypothetical protein
MELKAHAPPFFFSPSSFLLSSDISSDKSTLRGTPPRYKHVTGKSIPSSHIASRECSILGSTPPLQMIIFLKPNQRESAATPVSTLSQGDLQL